MISQNIKKQIIDQTNIVEVVGEVVQLTKKGSSYFGLCPFHNDNHPSMSVNNEKKMFNCFSCNTKGNVIYFMSRFHNITDDQATIMLAKRLGIEISEASTKEAIKQERLLKVLNDATLFYQFYLNNSEEGLEAKKYLFSRGIDEDIIKKLKIGLASSERNYLNLALKQKNHSELDQIELGLIKNDDTNTSYDVFRNRIIFPIENNNGQVVGFSGRIYRDNNQAKYINSSDNEIFHKGKILYHFHDAIPAIRENNKIIIFEGFMDVIAAIRANIHYGVATMGTALTNDHIKAILSLTKNIILCFDGDEAGIHAMKRSAMLFANYQIIPKAIVLPNNQDPDEYVKENGIDKLNQYFVANEKNVYAYLYDLAFKKFIKGDLESAENFKKEVFEFARFSKTNTIVEHFIKMLAEDLEVSFDSLMKDFGKMDYIHSSNEALPLEKTEIQTKIKPIKIKKKVFLAYNMLIKHMIFSKRKFIEFKNQIGDELYLDKKLAIHFEFVKKMEIFYAENEKMDEEDFMEISKKLDEANNSLAYSTFAREILEKVISNIKDDDEFMQCLDTINDCKKDLSGTRFYNKAISSRNIEDIKNFETIRKEHVKIMSKEEK